MHKIAIALYPGFQVLNLAVCTVLEFANKELPEPLYAVHLLSEHGGPVMCSGGFTVNTEPFGRRRYDTVLVVGDNDVLPTPPALVDFLRRSAKSARRIGATCTGAFNLAEAGVLSGKRVTTHWYHADLLRERYPDIEVEDDRIFSIDGSVWTSAGMTACIDLTLAIVERDCGAEVARDVAKKLVVYHRRTGGQSQYSKMLDLQPRSDRIQAALDFARSNLHEELSVDQLAEAAHLSPRQFARAFRDETGETPAKAVEHLRVEAARVMMESGRHSIDVIARETGFGDRERMRRSFLRAYGQPPQAIRRMVRGTTPIEAEADA